DHGNRLVILSSSNQPAGWPEREQLGGLGDGHVKPSDPPQPDRLYDTAKAYMKVLGRFGSDASVLSVIVQRIRTTRSDLSLPELIDSDELPYLGFGAARAQRLKRTWLTGDDLVNILEEEFTAEEPYRLRYATPSPDQQQWDHSVYTG